MSHAEENQQTVMEAHYGLLTKTRALLTLARLIGRLEHRGVETRGLKVALREKLKGLLGELETELDNTEETEK